MTEKLLTGTLSLNTNKQNGKHCLVCKKNSAASLWCIKNDRYLIILNCIDNLNQNLYRYFNPCPTPQDIHVNIHVIYGPHQANLVLIAYASSESRGTFRQKARSLAPLNGWACAVEICHDGTLKDTNSLDGAQIHVHVAQ